MKPIEEQIDTKEEIQYREIARRDFEREIYKQCDEEDRKENNP